MPLDYLPGREADLLAWATSYSSQITADPTSFGLDATQATVLATHLTSFQDLFNAASNNTTRTPAVIEAKKTAKATLVAYIRTTAGIIQSNPAVTNEQRAGLGLTVRDDEPTPVPVPDTAPVIDIKSVFGRLVTIRLHDAKSPTSRGKPAGVAGATVLSYVGETPPEEIGEWKFEGNTTRTTVDINFPATVPVGAKVWLTAFWFNPRQQSGLAATPISTYTNHEGVSKAA